MPERSFRFLHASDFRLDAVPRGSTEVPDHLRDLLLDAPYNAARRVFDAALTERVAFVILAGNILRPNLAGPRACFPGRTVPTPGRGRNWRLLGGRRSRSARCLARCVSPAGERAGLSQDLRTEFLHQDDGSPLAKIVGSSRGTRTLEPQEFSPDAVGLFSIGVACGEVDAAVLQAQAMHYWALGGLSERSTPVNSPGIAHFPGTPQGRSPAEVGPHGCTLVQVDDQRRPRLTFIATNTLEWLHEAVLIDASTRREDLQATLAERIRGLTAGSQTERPVTWTLGGTWAATWPSPAAANSAANCWTGCGSNTGCHCRGSGRSASNSNRKTPCRPRSTNRRRSWATSSVRCGSSN